MLDFAVIGLPRSGTTWAANWLTTDRSICLHDPLVNNTLTELADWEVPGKLCGVACTGLWMFPEWVAENVKHVVLIDRDPDEVNRSLNAIGLSPLRDADIARFLDMDGQRADMLDLFDVAAASDIWFSLVPELDYDVDRHMVLASMMINPYFPGWEPDPKAVKDWAKRLAEAAQS